MTRARLLLTACGLLGAGLWAAGCGQDAGGEGSVGFDLYVSRVALDRIGAFQVALVQNGSRFDCAELTQTCLKDNVPPAELVPLEDSNGVSHPVLRIPARVNGGSGTSTQETTLRGVPTGTDYTLVIEALSRTDTLLGSTCQARVEIGSGNNETLNPNPIDLFDEVDGGLPDGGTGLPTCDPVYAP